MMLRIDGRGVVTQEDEQRLKVTHHRAGLAIIHGLRAEHPVVFRGERGHGSLSCSTSKPSAVFVLHTPRSCRTMASNASKRRCTCASPSTRGTDTVRAAGCPVRQRCERG